MGNPASPLHARHRRAWILPVAMTFAAGLALCAPAQAFQPKLSASDAQAAVAEGMKQAKDATHGYVVADYVLYDRKDPLRIEPGDNLVDAVIVGTPREQLLYQSYLTSFQGKTLSAEQTQKLTNEANGTLEFRVFAHANSSKPEDKDFLSQFSPAKLALKGGKTLTAENPDIFGPSQDFFIVNGNRHAFRWLGSVTYRFDLNDLAQSADFSGLSGTLTFTDSSGHDYSFDVDFSKYS